jgi:hypothetical protein
MPGNRLNAATQILEADLAIIGGGFGGTAAALAAAEAGLTVILSEVTSWIGGQVTSQAVSALDEHRYIETFGGTRSYYAFREGVRDYYRRAYQGAAAAEPLNPGDGWVSRLCFEPHVGLQVLQKMLAPHMDEGRLRVLLGHQPVSAEVVQGTIQEITLQNSEGDITIIRAAYFLDATELGDLLPLAGVPYVTGAEAVEDTGEPHASVDGVHPERVQSFTHCFLAAYYPGEDHTIPKPRGYENFRDSQPFTLTLRTRGDITKRFYMFDGDLPFWSYRRVFSGALFNNEKRDVALINWDSNDYFRENLIDRSPADQARIVQEAKLLSLSFLYWLQTEVPRDDDSGFGYPGLRLLPNAVGTLDGLAQYPYIRESRRIRGIRRVVEQDIIALPGRGARAAHFLDSIGIGWYPIDLHRCAGDPDQGREQRIDFDPSLPFQIPLGALLSPEIDNLIAGAKNIATTHITNGAYRLHPIEWNVGESAGMLVAYCLAQNIKPGAVHDSPEDLRQYQKVLLNRGVPLFWSPDVPISDPDFSAIQSSLQAAPPISGSPRFAGLEVLPDDPLSRREAGRLVEQLNAQQNAEAARLLTAWNADPTGLSSLEEWQALFRALGLPSLSASGDYPTLRQVVSIIAS